MQKNEIFQGFLEESILCIFHVVLILVTGAEAPREKREVLPPSLPYRLLNLFGTKRIIFSILSSWGVVIQTF